MRFIKKYAEYVGCVTPSGERFELWRCPNKKCGSSISKDYICCPYCGQKIKFTKRKWRKSEFWKIYRDL